MTTTDYWGQDWCLHCAQDGPVKALVIVKQCGWPWRSLLLVEDWSDSQSTPPQLSRRTGADFDRAKSIIYTGLPISKTPPSAAASPSSAKLPVFPIVSGFAADTLLFSSIAPLLIIPLRAALRASGRNARLRRGRCPKCAYDLANLPIPKTCPECGRSDSAT